MDVRTRLERALGAAYSLDRELSGGGMSHVYVAEERAFGRRVVVKVLRDDLTEGASAERFKREISLVAKLQHPHIVPLLSAGENAGTLYYTMPFVEGESLRDRLRREGELPVQDVVRVMREVASALDYAHRRGIIHRDIKPENILFSDGNAVVTDFGIAKALEAARTQSDERGSTISQLGVALGTPAYMAPEQGAADPTVDHRADLYALGCVGYELLTGRPPFEGRATRQLLAAHATEAPRAVGAQRTNTPSPLAALIMQCLEKRAADRPQSAAEVLRALDGSAVTSSGATSLAEVRHRARAGWRRWVAGAVVLIAGITVGTLVARWRAGNRSELSSYDVGLGNDAPVVFRGNLSVSIAPKGDFVIYVTESTRGISQLRYRSLLDTAEHPLTGTDGASEPRISPDGKLVAFIRSFPDTMGRIRARVEVTEVHGGQPRPLGDLRAPIGLRWASASRFFVIDDDGITLRWFDPQNGETTAGSRIYYCVAPSPTDNGRALLCGGANYKFGRMVVLPDGSERRLRWKRRTDAGLDPRVVGSDFRVVDGRYVVFLSIEGELRAARFDHTTLDVGHPVTLVSGIRREAYQGLGQYDIAENGSLIYALGENAEVGQMMIVHPRSATPRPIPMIAEPAAFQRFDLSRDGRRLAAVVQGRVDQELRVYELEDQRSRTWVHAPYIGYVLWNERGDRLVFNVGDDSTSALMIGSPDATGSPDTLVRAVGTYGVPEPLSWRSDSLLIARIYEPKRVVVALDARLRSPRVDTILTDARFPDLSPDGRFLLFSRISTGDVLITPFPSRSSLSRVTDAEAIEARWASMTTVRYRSALAGAWFDVTVDSATGRVRGAPRLYYSDARFQDTPGWSHLAVSNEGMIFVQSPARTTAAFLRVVPNWVEKMKRVVDSVGAR